MTAGESIKTEGAQAFQSNRIINPELFCNLMRGLLFLISFALLGGRSIVALVTSVLAILIMYYRRKLGASKDII